MKRREFLKNTAITGAAVSMGPLTGAVSFAQPAKSKVVIANDPQCFVNNASQASRVQDMVDHTIMALTGKNTKAAAYEALFPKPVTTATKILIKFNESAGDKSLSRNAVQAALTSGLTSMLNGTYPANKISTLGTGGTATGPKFTVGSDSYQIKSAIVDCDYFINFAVCWCVGSNTTGVTLTLKNMMGAVAGNLGGGFHGNFTNASGASLSICNSQQMFKDKQVLVLIDAISLCTVASGPAGMANAYAYSIIASKDMVAADYQGLQILKAKGLSSDRQAVANTILVNAAKPAYGLGTNDPNSMDIVNIGPPWTTQVVVSGEKSEHLGLQVQIDQRPGGQKIVFTLKNKPASDAQLSVYNASGEQIWSHNSLTWNCETLSGAKASPGTYFYSIRAGRETLKGKVMVGT
jgi:uncharacterized protein (DUF362 family)